MYKYNLVLIEKFSFLVKTFNVGKIKKNRCIILQIVYLLWFLDTNCRSKKSKCTINLIKTLNKEK